MIDSILAIIGLLIVTMIACAIVALVIEIVRYNRTYGRIRHAVAAADPAILDRVYQAIEDAAGSEPRSAVACHRPDTEPNASPILILPHYIHAFPWGGLMVRVDVDEAKMPHVILYDDDAAEQTPPYRIVALPEWAYTDDPEQSMTDLLLARVPSLAALIDAIIDERTKDVLGYLLTAESDGYGTDELDQLRIGGPPIWVQTDEEVPCPLCSTFMRLIVQIPGSLVDNTLAEATVYLLGCQDHPDEQETIRQWA